MGSSAMAMAMPSRKRMPWNRSFVHVRAKRGRGASDGAFTADQLRAPASLSASPRMVRMASPAAWPSRL